MNKVILMGRLVSDPELRYTQQNIPVCRIRLAVNKPGKPKEGQPTAEFLNVVAWRGTAEFIAKHFRKGTQVLVEGHLKVNSWDDNGSRRYEEYTQADHVYFADSRKTDQYGAASQSVAKNHEPQSGSEGCTLSDDEDIPF